MLKFDPDDLLIDLGLINLVGPFKNNDEKIKFEKNIKKVHPRYLEEDNSFYQYNNKGYRTKNIENLDKEFVLIFGCSYTEGVGLHNNHIWCNVLLDNIGIDRLNLAKAGTGPDIQYYNTVQYIKCNYPKPKLVIFQWPESTRKSFTYYEDNNLFLKHHHTASKTATKDTKWYLRRYCMDQSELQTNNYFWITAATMLWNQIGVPVFNWSWQGDYYNDYYNVKYVQTSNTGYDKLKNRARDCSHDGPEKHKQTADILFKDVDNLLKNC